MLLIFKTQSHIYTNNRLRHRLNIEASTIKQKRTQKLALQQIIKKIIELE